MAKIDPDIADPRLVEEAARMFEAAAERLRALVLNPPGRSPEAIAFNQSQAAGRLAQVQATISQLRRQSANWTSIAVRTAVERGLEVADRQVQDAGVALPQMPTGSFATVNRRAVEVLARDTVGDLTKAADILGRQATIAIHHMAASGVTNGEVNRILAGGIIEGQPTAATQALRAALAKVHGEKVTIHCKDGVDREYDTEDYARLVANTKLREATTSARHERLAECGLDLVRIDGSRSMYPCTLLLGRVFSLSGRSDKYPALSTVSDGQPPYHLWHPHCHKFSVPFVEALASDVSKAVARGESGHTPAERQTALIEDIRRRAREAGYVPPPHGQAA